MASFAEEKQAVLDRWEKGFVANLIRQARGNIAKAAREAKMDRKWLYKLMQRHGFIGTKEWSASRLAKEDTSLCPCDGHPRCDTCGLACSCHWRKDHA